MAEPRRAWGGPATTPIFRFVPRSLSYGGLGLLVGLALVLPGHPLAPLSGVPLDIPGGVALALVLALAYALAGTPLPRPKLWLGALTLVVAARLGSGLLAPSYGFEARYWAGENPGRAPERSTESSIPGATRADHALAFEGAEFPVHFFNDIRRFNFYTPTEAQRDLLPFHAEWRGLVVEPPTGASLVRLVSNGRAALALNGAELATLAPSGRNAEALVSIPAGEPTFVLEARFTRASETRPFLRLEWVDASGATRAISRSEVVASERQLGQLALEPWLRWLGYGALIGLAGLWLATTTLALAGAMHELWRPDSVKRGARLERVIVGAVVIWAAFESLPGWLPFDRHALLLSGGNDWLAYESFARDILFNGLLQNYGRALGQGEAFYYQPAYSYALALVHAVMGEGLAGVLWVQHVALGLVVGLVFALARRLWGMPAGLIAGALAFAYRPLELEAVARLLLSENLFFLTLPAALLLIVRAYQQPTVRTAALAGAFLGLAILTRSTPLLFYPFAAYGVARAAHRLQGRGPALRALAVFTLACFLVVGTATLRNYLVSGRTALITTSGGANLWEAHRPSQKVDLRGLDQHRLYNSLGLDRQTREVLEFIRQDPLGYAATLWPTAAYAVGYAEPVLPGRGVEWPLLALAAVYILSLAVVPAVRSGPAWLLHAFVLTHLIQTALFFSHQYGFRLPLPMYLPMMASVGGAAACVLSSLRVGRLLESRQRLATASLGGTAILAMVGATACAAGLRDGPGGAPERLYALEGDPAAVARVLRGLPTEQQVDRIYAVGQDTRTREIAYLRGLAYPTIKWLDAESGLVLPGRGLQGLLFRPSAVASPLADACLADPWLRPGEPSGNGSPVLVYQLDDDALARCVQPIHLANVRFNEWMRVLGADMPQRIEPGQALNVTVYWEVLARPPARYRPLVELLDGQGRSWGQAENNPYGADLWAPGEIIASAHRFSADATAPPGPYTIDVSFVGSTPRPLVSQPGIHTGRASLGLLDLTSRSAPLPAGALPAQRRADVTTGEVTFLGSTLARDSVRPGEPLGLALFWQARRPSPPALAARVLLHDSNNQTVATWPATPLDDRYPVSSWRAGESIRDERVVTVPGRVPVGRYDVLVAIESAGQSNQVPLGSLTVAEVSRQFTSPSVRTRQDVQYGERLRLLGFDLRDRRLGSGETLDLSLVWQAAGDLSERYAIALELVNEGSRVVLRRESEPADGQRPTSGWLAGEFVTDSHRIRLPRDVPRGRYRVELTVFERQSGRILPTTEGLERVVLATELSVE